MPANMMLYNLSHTEQGVNNDIISKNLIDQLSGELFTLNTCQRKLFFGPASKINKIIFASKNPDTAQCYQGPEAYRYLLETICGLQSRLQGENEIVAQFKIAYQSFLSAPNKDTRIQRILEKLFKDAKHIRTQYLKQIGQYSYAGISRKLLQSRNKHNAQVVIMGSGRLAEDLIKVCRKHFDICVIARNTARQAELRERYQVQTMPWEKLGSSASAPFIINTIGDPSTVLFNQTFFNIWDQHPEHQRLFIDLGSPSVIQTDLHEDQNVIRLQSIFKQVERLNQKKQAKIKLALGEIESTVLKRWPYFLVNLPQKSSLQPALHLV